MGMDPATSWSPVGWASDWAFQACNSKTILFMKETQLYIKKKINKPGMLFFFVALVEN